MKKYFKLVFYLLCSISFLVYKVLLAIQTYSLFNGLEPFYLAYQLFYNICITLLTLLFVYKLIVTFLDIFQEKFKIRRVLIKEEKKQKELEGKQQQLEKLQAEIDNLKNN